MSSKSQPQDITIVGGGIAGLVSALILIRKGHNITLIENSDSCGGLLKTFYNEENTPFDLGTHILSRLGIPELDDLLYGDLFHGQWQRLDILKTASLFKGKLNEQCQFPDLRNLPEEKLQAARAELLAAPETVTSPANAEEHALQTYGPTITHEVIQPFMHKIYGHDLKDMAPSAIAIVGWSRFILYDQVQAEKLKQTPLYDRKISHTSWKYGISPHYNYYPTNDGIQLWIDGLITKLENAGAKILTQTSVSSIEREGSDIKAVTLSDNQVIQTDHLYWTISPAQFILAAGGSIPANLKPPQFRASALLNLIFDRNFLTQAYYVWNHESDTFSFRTTLYSNLRKEKSQQAPFNCTIEVIGDQTTIDNPQLEQILIQELIDSKIITPEHQITYSHLTTSPKGFPIPDINMKQAAKDLVSASHEMATNLSFFGRARGNKHFMNEVITEIWEELENSN